MTAALRPWCPDDFDDWCETCGAAPGQLCKPACDTGYTAKDLRRDAEHRDQNTTTPPQYPTMTPKE
ncbi:hypothetical protein ACF1AY_35825 [Streptomyces sp. NPDC014776]|uniref:hypothetical protein n=1 Tax=unclassified Streptomyces TaxID=2593676 RepID=UPI0036F5C481